MKKQTEMILSQQFRYASRFILWAFLLTAAHRFLAFPDLLSGTQFQDRSRAFLIGLASDLWAMTCFSLFILLLSVFFIKRPEKLRSIYRFFVVLLSLAFATHLNYIKFFKHPIIPLHLRYIYDWQFIRSMGASIFADRNVIVLLAGGLVSGQLFFEVLRRRPKGFWKKSLLIYSSVVIAASILHLLHNRYKEQWFIPETLRYNHLEGLVYQSLRQKFPKNFTTEEAALLQKLVPQAQAELLPEGFRVGQWAMQPFGTRLREVFQATAQEGKKPILLVVTMESLRMADIDKPGEHSRTPYLSQLTQESPHFAQAYSTGNITRGAQEAIFCGVFSGVNYSLMRHEVKNDMSCVSREANIKNVDSFWYHGGNALFDNQAAFWKENQMLEQLSLDDFSVPEFTNGWGVHDVTFFNQAAENLKKFHGHSQAKASMGMMLSLSNHIPWDLPKDVSPELQKTLDENNNEHPSHKTVMYADEALGLLLSKLKDLGLWENSLIIVTGDHGTLLPKLNQDYIGSNDLLLSNVPLILTGGLTEAARSLLNPEQVVQLSDYSDTRMVSHAQIASFMAYVLGLDAISFPTPPLFADLDWPIFVNLGDEFYFPRSRLSWPRKKLFATDLSRQKDLDATSLADLLFAKAYFYGLKKLQ